MNIRKYLIIVLSLFIIISSIYLLWNYYALSPWISAISNPNHINKLYVLLSLISLYQLAKSHDAKDEIFHLIHSVSVGKDKSSILSSVNLADKPNSDISLKYSHNILNFLL